MHLDSRRQSGGVVENLPCHTFPSDDGGVDAACRPRSPSAIAVKRNWRKTALCRWFTTNSDFAAFIGAQSCKTRPVPRPDATANARPASRLPYLFACCRFAHYLGCIVRDKIGSFREREMERWLNDWVMNFVDGDPANSLPKPSPVNRWRWREAQVQEIEDQPGCTRRESSSLRPHYQLEGLVWTFPAPRFLNCRR